MIYVPKGSMCAACMKLDSLKCRVLEFDKMPVIKKHPDSIITVKCVEFTRK